LISSGRAKIAQGLDNVWRLKGKRSSEAVIVSPEIRVGGEYQGGEEKRAEPAES